MNGSERFPSKLSSQNILETNESNTLHVFLKKIESRQLKSDYLYRDSNELKFM